MRYIKNENIQPSYLVPIPMQQWNDDERSAGRCARKQRIDPVNVAEQLFVIAITAVGQQALSETDIRASIGLQDSIDPERHGEPSVALGNWIAIPEDAHSYLVKKLDAQRWFSLECREILEMVQEWRNAPQDKPLALGDVEPRNGKVSQLAKAGRR